MSESTTKPRILIIGDAVAQTGFARVIYEIFRPLTDRFELVQLGTNYFGDPHSWPWRVFPAGIDAYQLGAHRVKKLVSGLRPDLIFLLQDPWALVAYLKELEPFPQIPVVVYASFNAANIDPAVLPLLSRANRFVVYTEFAREAVLDALAQSPGLHFPEVEVLPHGVDTTVFRPLDEDREQAKAMARRKIYPENEALQKGFIVLNANRNQPRKRIDLTMEGFHLFAQGKPENVFLHLHMGLKDIGWDLKHLSKRFGLEDRLIYSTGLDEQPQIGEASLNDMFNAADVGLNTASSEGWGLVSFEQAAAGLPQVVPDHTSGRELWSGCAQLLPYAITLVNPHSKIDEHIIHPDAIAQALETCWQDREALRTRGELCYRNAVREKYQWRVISGQWREVFESELKQR